MNFLRKKIFIFCLLIFISSCGSDQSFNSEAGDDLSENGEEIENEEITLVDSVVNYTSRCLESNAEDIEVDDEDQQLFQSERASLDCQVNYQNSEIELSQENVTQNSLSNLLIPSPLDSLPTIQKLKLFLVAEINSPLVNGNYLGATDIDIYADKAVVTYNTVGEPYQGAVQFIDFSNPQDPFIISQIIFPTIDVSSAYLTDDLNLYLAEAQSVDITGFNTGAQMRVLELDEDFEIVSFSDPIDIASFVATDILYLADEIYVVSGNTGGVSIYDATSLDEIDYIPIEDARSLTYDENTDQIYVYQGSPGRITAINIDDLVTEEVDSEGGNIAEAKSTILSYGNYLFIGASDGGALIVDPETLETLESIDNPVVEGLADNLTATNAVTANEDLIFISNGQAGIRVAEWSATTTNDITTSVIGTLDYNDEHSANAISFDGEYLLVASGIGGIKIIKTVSNPYLFSMNCSSLEVVFCEDFDFEDEEEIDTPNSTSWTGKWGEFTINATAIHQGGRLNENAWIGTQDSFDINQDGAHYSIKVFNSLKFKILKNPNIGTEVQYDGQGNLLGIVGNAQTKNKRTIVSFEFPENQEFIVAHVYQRGDQIQIMINLPDGTELYSPIIESKINNIDDPSTIRLETYDGHAQSEETPSFDDLLIEEWDGEFYGSETL